ncbi:MAG: flagellar biosynthetic protein FliR [Candidatus Eisenbacteria bacterium]|uniref:Flagellar biosynthetic protein FliR n=1 Tax=Eiseniibacteriota bacterium TaxID=2212470 RepID=A0A948W7F1_UNCEI|nr:flagellar biosynthetic protein FliR [Candidatus Eisenbacteria bacterium]MBU1950957.1 flagellar biosynthetic protein FliR [Candidatus Eisenbacteria bacterium]MBU2692170.1 flagellar biosynthetic protein FliR [Candidatus Eisenbacteria bacterium]
MDFHWVPVALLVLFRSLGFFMTSPILARREIPGQIKVAAAITLTVILTPIAPPGPIEALNTLPGTLLAVVSEALLGALLGLAASFPFVGINLAGQLMGTQMGIGLAGIMDPTSGNSGGIIGRFLETTAILIFLLSDGHHILLRALSFSLRMHPPGTLGMGASVANTLIDLSASIFVVGLEVGGAVLGVLFLAEAAMGFVARTVPQMNIFIIGFPIKIALGLGTLALTLPLFVSTLDRLFAGMESDLITLLRGM